MQGYNLSGKWMTQISKSVRSIQSVVDKILTMQMSAGTLSPANNISRHNFASSKILNPIFVGFNNYTPYLSDIPLIVQWHFLHYFPSKHRKAHLLLKWAKLQKGQQMLSLLILHANEVSKNEIIATRSKLLTKRSSNCSNTSCRKDNS